MVDIELAGHAPCAATPMVWVVAREVAVLVNAKLLVSAAVVELLELAHDVERCMPEQ